LAPSTGNPIDTLLRLCGRTPPFRRGALGPNLLQNILTGHRAVESGMLCQLQWIVDF
jgi:hypothetical protein